MEDDQPYLIWAGRYQPPHNGHKQLLSHSLATWPEPHIVGIVWGHNTADSEWAKANPKHFGSKYAFSGWERRRLFELIVWEIGATRRVSVVLVPRLDQPNGWEFDEIFPRKRIRCTTDKDSADLANVEFWRSQGEKVRVLSAPPGTLTGTEFRKRVLAGEEWRSFVPEECHEYFISIDGPTRLTAQAKG